MQATYPLSSLQPPLERRMPPKLPLLLPAPPQCPDPLTAAPIQWQARLQDSWLVADFPLTPQTGRDPQLVNAQWHRQSAGATVLAMLMLVLMLFLWPTRSQQQDSQG